MTNFCLVDKFGGNDFYVWKMKMQMYLLDKDMRKIVNDSLTKLVTPTLQVDWEKTNGKG